MWPRIRWEMNRLRQKLWARPLLYAVLAVSSLAVAAAADRLPGTIVVPDLRAGTVEDLLAIIATSMLAVATLAVASMVSAYASASSTATPRAFSLVLADDVSQTALSGFIGAFIFSIVALTAVKTGSYGRVGLFVTFLLTILIFVAVIMIFVRWVDRIARLGRLGHTIDRVEQAARAAIDERRRAPLLGGVPVETVSNGHRIFGTAIGYVQYIDRAALQRCAEGVNGQVIVEALPGTFVAPGRSLATLAAASAASAAAAEVESTIAGAFVIGDDRTYEDDPRFGLVALAEIAARALSPAVNDPGTAIDITGTFVRLFARWAAPVEAVEVRFDRVMVPELSAADMFDDAFTAIARDGAGTVEVAIRLQKAFLALASTGDDRLRSAAIRHSTLALARAELALKLPEEREHIRQLATQVAGPARATRTGTHGGR